MGGFLARLFSGEAAEPIAAIGTVLDDLFTSDEEQLSLEMVKQRLAQKPALAQTEINKVQAGHRSIFVAGARPFLMWVCGLGFLFAFVVNPVLQWLLPGMGTPELPLDTMLELTLAMLGLASLRTVEKLKGVSK
ncbi:3TM-type holin [Shewanella surugensis]|uniref:Holin family protein n=1 Tax=Shewanella surugensis TaxID=212020 RepID=A0ABT0L6U4_9GAMM|nr:3TM-type holin [Shewanella surugensis]MCL1123210.1 holin family protein [Shewanella surugensis]